MAARFGHFSTEWSSFFSVERTVRTNALSLSLSSNIYLFLLFFVLFVSIFEFLILLLLDTAVLFPPHNRVHYSLCHSLRYPFCVFFLLFFVFVLFKPFLRLLNFSFIFTSASCICFTNPLPFTAFACLLIHCMDVFFSRTVMIQL